MQVAGYLWREPGSDGDVGGAIWPPAAYWQRGNSLPSFKRGGTLATPYHSGASIRG